MKNVSRRVVMSAGFVLAVALARPAVAGPLDHPGYTKAFSCSACHGFGGNSRSDAMPILAGQLPGYLKKALQDYATGKRPSPEMEPYAKMAIELGLDDVVSYFASQKKEATPIRVAPASAERGRTAARACAACHGPDGKGDPAKGVPDISGQAPGYLQSQLLLFKAERRSPADDQVKQLKATIKTIPDDTLADLAAYYATLR